MFIHIYTMLRKFQEWVRSFRVSRAHYNNINTTHFLIMYCNCSTDFFISLIFDVREILVNFNSQDYFFMFISSSTLIRLDKDFQFL